jgi:hypothetical protein
MNFEPAQATGLQGIVRRVVLADFCVSRRALTGNLMSAPCTASGIDFVRRSYF